MIDLDSIHEAFEKCKSPKYLSETEILDRLDQIIPSAVNFLSSIDDNNFHRTEDPRLVEKAIGKPLPMEGEEFSTLIEFLQTQVFTRFPSTSSKQFLGYVPSDALPEAVLGAAITPFYNQFTGSVQGSPGATAIEAQVIQWIAEILNFPKISFGSFTSGGSGANLTCIYAGITHQGKLHGIDLREDGLFSKKRLLVYISEESHNSNEKALLFLGLGKKSIRKVPTNKYYEMEAKTIETMIDRDMEELGGRAIPIMIIGTAGTTNTGSIDDLERIRALCTKKKMWFHVDGAYGSFASLPRPHLFKGMEKADSIALDAHKWLFSPFESGIAIVRDHKIMRAAFELTADYLVDSEIEDEIGLQRNFRSYGFPLTREMRGLKVWFIFQSLGVNGIKDAIERNLLMADYLRAILQRHSEFEIIATGQLSIVCFRWKKSDKMNDMLIKSLQENQRFYLSKTFIDGKTALRICIINLRSNLTLIDELVEELETLINIINK